MAQKPAKQNRSALSVSPAILEHVLDPRVGSDAKVAVTNVTEFAFPVKTSVRSFLAQEEVDEANREAYDASAWFKVNEPEFVLQPHERRDVSITISPPKTAEPGGHYATILFQPMIPVEATSAGSAQLAARVGVIALLVVKGDIVEKVSLAEGLQTQGFHQSGPIEFTLRLRNEGNVHVLPTGGIDVHDWQGHRIARVPLEPSVLLPGTTKVYRFEWEKQWPVGRYRADAQITYGTGQVRLRVAPVAFWAFPLPALAFVAAISGLVISLRLRRPRSLALRTAVPAGASASGKRAVLTEGGREL